jgi:hypothetical protein
LLPDIHLRVGACNKNQIANRDRHQKADHMAFSEKLRAQGFYLRKVDIRLDFGEETDIDLRQC